MEYSNRAKEYYRHLDYELSMPYETRVRVLGGNIEMKSDREKRDLYILNCIAMDSVLTHIRIIYEFFDEEVKRNPLDLKASSFLPEILLDEALTPEWRKFKKDNKDAIEKLRIDRLLSHLSKDRVNLIDQGKHLWNFDEILTPLSTIIRLFISLHSIDTSTLLRQTHKALEEYDEFVRRHTQEV